MLKAYRYRIYPATAQQKELEGFFGCTRKVFNLALEIRKRAYDELNIEKFVSYEEIANQLPGLREEYDYIKACPSQILQQKLMDQTKAYTNFFSDMEKYGRPVTFFKPRYKKKSAKQSIRFPQGFDINEEEKVIDLPKIGKIECRFHRPLKGVMKNMTITKLPSGKYYVSIQVDTKIPAPAKKKITEQTAIGLDRGLKSFVVYSDGTTKDIQQYFRKAEKRLEILQQRHELKNNGSNRKNKSRIKIAREHEHIANQRKDFLHKLSSEITNQYDTVCMETLNIKGMSKRNKPKQDETGKFLPNGQSAKSGLNKSILDAGWGMFETFVKYKCEWKGKNFLQIGRWEPSSKTCSCCDHVNENLTLEDRAWTCGNCGVTHDRDENASQNIKRWALRDALNPPKKKKSGQELSVVRAVKNAKPLSL